MSLEQDIKDFMGSIGVEVVGIARPGRFDGPPSLDPTYIMKGAKSIISFAIPMDVPAIYDFLQKKTAIPQNIDQLRGHQRSMHAAIKLVKFLEAKGYQAKDESPNVKWRKTPNPLAMTPRFSHRYGAIVSGIAGMGLSGNVVSKEYGASMYINTVFTDAVLESDPMMPPREIYDKTCQHCMACAASCPTKMFEKDHEEYALLNGKLVPRGKKRNIYLCTIGCAGMHATYPNKRHSTWGHHNVAEWVGNEPVPEGAFLHLAAGVMKHYNIPPQFNAGDLLARPYEEGILESPNFPDYEDLSGETEGEKIKSFVKALEKATGIKTDDNLPLTCGTCSLVCGPTVKENQKRYKMLAKSGFVVYGSDKEVIHTHDYDEAITTYEANPWVPKPEIKRQHIPTLVKLLLPKLGIDLHGMLRIGDYNRRLKKATAEQANPHVDSKPRDAAIEAMELEITEPVADAVAGD